MISLRDVVTGFGNRDPLAEVWRRSLRGGGGGSTVITGVPPLRYIGDGRPLTDYLISGNTVQDGTPSADAPVDATGSGARTGNIINPEDMLDGYFINTSGVIEGSSRRTTTPIIAVNGAYMVLTYSTNLDRVLALYAIFSNGAMIRRLTGIASGAVIDISKADSICVSFYSADSQAYVRSSDLQIQLAYGSTALPYEPYGFKLPLTVNGVEYPIYLGTVPTMRRIKKLVLTGEEEIAIKLGNAKWFIPIADMRLPTTASILWYCSHYRAVANDAKWASYDYMISWSTADNGSSKGLRIRDVNFLTDVTVADFKAYLAQQYATGTPVTVWYVLAEPETGIVNEPLMKIGDYADTVSAEQAGVTIPTVSGANVLDVPTEVPPSEIAIKGGIRSV